ncbi:Lysine acetyltransferase [Zancudomyces culisetae]|uniref:Lysine acetyltransferase n=1 Tax=Zancudomyces culisetae TaxID=1213189 RepID=A0A1R1PK25_ZANCU|nr:Lysine acetyltransferase [Zancudomyces culisetae]|eukprot:OMH81318.1 Lysine acetyltransferase [Zancudomyces culisetae]
MAIEESLDNFELVPATTIEQIHETWLRTHAEWGVGVMDVKTYHDREHVLANQDFTGKNITIWLYGEKKERLSETGSLNFKSSLETFKRKALIKRKGKSEVEEILCHSIATVFVPICNRGHGYANGMIGELYKALSKLGEASTLYSDIGRKFYSKFGWDVHPFVITDIEISAINQSDKQATDTEQFVVELIDEELAKEVAEEDCKRLAVQLEEMDSSQSTKFLILPEVSAYQWRWAREKFEAEKCFGIDHSNGNGLKIFGARIKNSTSFIIWAHKFRENKMYILRENWSNEKHIKPLMDACIAECKKHSLSKITSWNLNPASIAVLEREYGPVAVTSNTMPELSLPSLAIFNKEKDEKVDWVLNSDYAWV